MNTNRQLTMTLFEKRITKTGMKVRIEKIHKT